MSDVRLIDAKQLVRAICLKDLGKDIEDMIDCRGHEYIRLIEEAPTIEPPVVSGKWLPSNYKPTMYARCSLCNARKNFDSEYNFCPNCGAKMETTP